MWQLRLELYHPALVNDQDGNAKVPNMATGRAIVTELGLCHRLGEQRPGQFDNDHLTAGKIA